MKKLLAVFLSLAAAAVLTYLLVPAQPTWEGVDETVVGKYAREAGHPAQKALIDTDRGDLLHFFFLLAGLAGGFMGGYCFRALFPPQSNPPKQ